MATTTRRPAGLPYTLRALSSAATLAADRLQACDPTKDA